MPQQLELCLGCQLIESDRCEATTPCGRGPQFGIDWIKTTGPLGHQTCGAHYAMTLDGEPTGYVIKHCGHPTANWPYYIVRPDGQEMYSGGIGLGYGFRRLAEAKAAAIADHQEGEQ